MESTFSAIRRNIETAEAALFRKLDFYPHHNLANNDGAPAFSTIVAKLRKATSNEKDSDSKKRKRR